MTDIFISYSSRDRARVRPLAEALIAEGFDVWWDTSGLQSGHAWRKEIEKHLEAARTVIVCWSAAARESEWVIQEADHAKSLGRLRPVSLDPDVQLPLGFREIQSLDLSSWLSGRDASPLTRLIVAIESTPGIPSKQERAARQRHARQEEQERRAAEAERVRAAEEERRVRREAAERDRQSRKLATEVNARHAASASPPRQFKLPISAIVAGLLALVVGGWLVNKYNEGREPPAQQVASGSTQSSEGAQQTAEPEAAPYEPPPPIEYPRCEQPYALECINPTIRRVVVEARANAADAEIAAQRASAAQLVAQEAARRARAGERYFRTETGSRSTFALFEGTESYNRDGRFGIIRYHPGGDIERYEGQYSNGTLRAEGSGVSLYRAGWTYRGAFIEGVANGMGVRDESYLHRAGLWINGEPNSWVSTYEDGRRFEGTMEMGVRWTAEGQIEGAGYWSRSVLTVPMP